MSKLDPVRTNPNDQMPAGGGLKPGEIVLEEFEDQELYGDDDGLGPVDEDEDEPGLPEEIEDRENQAGTEQIDGGNSNETEQRCTDELSPKHSCVFAI